MKLRIRLGLWLLAALVLFTQNVGFTQQTGIPRIISYQGQIKSENNLPISGNHKVSVAFYNNSDGTDMIWNGIYEVNAEGGIFNILLGSGAYPLPEKLDHAIYLGTSIDGGKELRPLSMLAAVPYALAVADKSITKDKLDLTYLGGISLNGKPITASGSTLNLKPGPGVNLLYDEHTGSLSFYNSSMIGTSHSQSILSDPCGTNVDGGPASPASTNVVGGGCFNTANPNVSAPHTGYASIVGGYGNTTYGYYSIIGGGYEDTITSSGYYSGIVAGNNNTSSNSHNFIGAGLFNTVAGQAAGIVAGQNNITSSSYSLVGSGQSNTIDASSENAVIAGGYGNSINLSDGAFIGGGNYNANSGPYSVIVGGGYNIQGSQSSFIGGGDSNITGVNFYNNIVGGKSNFIDNGDYASILGGRNNVIGGTNVLSVDTYRAGYSVISGGQDNFINGDYSAIAGGRNLTIGTRSFGFNAGGIVDVSGDSNVALFGDVDLWLYNRDNKARKVKFYEPSSSGSNFTSFRAQAQAFDINYTLPAVEGDSTDVLINMGGGLLAWGDGSALFTGTGGGADDWKITGNSNTDPASGKFLGTNNNKGLEFHIFDSDAVNKGSKRVMRFSPNTISANIIGGYQSNNIPDSIIGSVISGGGSNGNVNSVFADFSVIGGGQKNTIESSDSALPALLTTHAFIGGGFNNKIRLNSDGLSDDLTGNVGGVIVGGTNNILQDYGSFIGGGDSNEVKEEFGTIGGGQFNRVFGRYGTVGGGFNNGSDQTRTPSFTFVGGGSNNLISSSAADYSVICGGSANVAMAAGVFIGGGGKLTASDTVASPYSSLVGGFKNKILNNSDNSFMGGGTGNLIQTASNSVLGGGTNNKVLGSYGFIGGGDSNMITAGFHNSILNGKNLRAQSYAQTVIGFYNKAQGLSAEPHKFTRNAAIEDDRVFIIGAGHEKYDSISLLLPPISETRRNAFEVSNSGHTIVYHNLGSTKAADETESALAVSTAAPIVGASYKDNIPCAWGYINNAGIKQQSFGVFNSVGAPLGGGGFEYTIDLDYVDPYTGAQVQMKAAAITATLVYDQEDPTASTFHCLSIVVTPIKFIGGRNQFKVRIYDPNGSGSDTCPMVQHQFMFHVIARPM